MTPPLWRPPIGIPGYPPAPPWAPPNPALGTWTYRSFLNNPDIGQAFNDLEFGRGELRIDELRPGVFEGRLWFGDTYQFGLRGTADLSSFPASVRFRGVGDTTDSKGQIYDYAGFFLPMWSNGESQRAAIAGTTVRSVAHNGGQAKAGFVGTFIALKRDDDPKRDDDSS
jgi:hypothetical protein